MNVFEFRRRTLLAAVMAGILTVGSAIWGAAPTNDLCAGAILIPDDGPFPVLTTPVDITDAGTTGDPSDPSCSFGDSRSVWYRFRPAQSALYSLSVGMDTATTVQDTVMALYSSPSACNGPLTKIVCNDDTYGSLRSALLLNLQAGVQYYVVVWEFDTNAPSALETTLQLRVAKPVPPASDTCAAAQIIPSAGPFPHFTALTDITLATTVADPPLPICQTNLSRSVWYRFTPAATLGYRISTCEDTSTTVADTVLAVYTSAGGCAGPFTPVACSDDDCAIRRAVVDIVLTAGTTYHIVVWEYDIEPPVPGQTLVQLRITASPPVFTPTTSLPGGRLQLNFNAVPGPLYTIQSATASTNWTSLGAVQNSSNGAHQFTVSNTAAPTRIFRVKSPHP